MDREDIEHLQKAYETFRQTKFPRVNRAFFKQKLIIYCLVTMNSTTHGSMGIFTNCFAAT